ncbi:hypothetical protein C0995_005065 [Termitomyces sp. Mi166|nr:hypothetical protein C0995_005065 [Termitomyces sp. Mi166\
MSPFLALLELAVCLLGVLAVHGSVLMNFQVAQPPIVPRNAKQCIVKVLQRDFAFSYGSAEIVQLTPPADCGPVGSWAAITLNLTVTSNGTQYDRLGHFTFQNVEIWRTSTPEPTRGDGIIWTYVKDVSRFMPLFATEGTFIFQLDNLVQTGLDGIYSKIIASGNGQEEFWVSRLPPPHLPFFDRFQKYFNAVNDFLTSLPNGTTYGQGSFREVRLLIDGQIAGAALPYSVIFTGGLAPSLWRPIAAYGALDLPSYFLDATPFVPLLTDGNPHEFTIDVVSAEDDHTILQNWYVSGLLQVITDSSSKPTTGNITVYNAPLYAQTNTTGNVGLGAVNITVQGSRDVHVEAEILSGSGELTHVVWTQELAYSNTQSYSSNASLQVLRQITSGRVISTHNGLPVLEDIFSYPLNVEFAYQSPQWTNWTTYIDHSYNRTTLPNPLALMSTIKENQITNGFYQLMTGGNYGYGWSTNTFNYTDSVGNTYTRQVIAALNDILLDQEDGSLARTNFVIPVADVWTPSVQNHHASQIFVLVQSAVLVDFQVAQPPPVPTDAKQCTIQVLQRDFAFSFGSAEVVQLTPPTDCGSPGSWAAVTLNFTVTSNGTQFDRLGIFTFQNVEIWRTSTPEPTQGDGIIWTYVKDVTRYIPLFAKPGTFILQLDNLIQPGLDGIYSTTLHATYFASSLEHPPAMRSDLIIPLSTFANDTGNDASVPPGFSLNVTLPQNTVSVFAELYASGNGAEEFWYFNVADEFLPNLPPGTASQRGPFREVRLPITSYGALDLPTYFLDLTPFVPIFADGEPHNITIDVASAEANHTILQNWFVSGLLQVNTDESSERTIGNITSYVAQPFATATTTGNVGDNGDINITVTATRKIHIEADIISGSGKSTHATWTQDLQYSNIQNYLDNTTIQNVLQTVSGTSSSSHNNVPTVVDTFSYPLGINLTLLDPSGNSFVASFDHSYDRDLLPFPAVSRSNITMRQLALAFFKIAQTGNTGNGTNTNVFTYSDSAGNTYQRKVDAVLNNITFDEQSGSLAPIADHDISKTSVPSATKFTFARLPGGRVVGI